MKNIGYLGDLFSEARMLAGSYTRPFWISSVETLGTFFGGFIFFSHFVENSTNQLPKHSVKKRDEKTR